MWVPPSVGGAGEEAVELARMAGLYLDPWQEFVLRASLGERPDGNWAAFEVGLTLSRQNGKNGTLEARQLAGLYLFAEKLQIHSAHLFDTSQEAFTRLLELIEGTDDLRRRVKRVSKTHGDEGITLLNGPRIRFRTRTSGGGRGFTCDTLYLDEAMIIQLAMHGALLPTLSAVANPQVWYTGSAVDQWIHDHGHVMADIRRRGIAGDDPALAYFEWSANIGDPADDDPDEVTDEIARNEEHWAEANPALGIRISVEHTRREQRSMDSRTFAVERLGIGDWPDEEEEENRRISAEVWTALGDPHSQMVDPIVIAFDVSPDRSSSSIGAAGWREDGDRHIELIQRGRGTGWVVDRLVELRDRHKPVAIVCDAAGPAASLLKDCEAAGLEIETLNAREHAQCCGVIYDACDQGTVHHIEQPELTGAVRGARERPLGDAWAWSRKSSTIDISPLVSVTLALGHLVEEAESIWDKRQKEGTALL